MLTSHLQVLCFVFCARDNLTLMLVEQLALRVQRGRTERIKAKRFILFLAFNYLKLKSTKYLFSKIVCLSECVVLFSVF